MALGTGCLVKDFFPDFKTSAPQTHFNFAVKVFNFPGLNHRAVGANGIFGLNGISLEFTKVVDNNHHSVHPHPVTWKGADVGVLAGFAWSSKGDARLFFGRYHFRAKKNVV